jgi:predicted nucleotidyltransferase
MPQTTQRVTSELLEGIVRRAVAVARPEKIILFGSAADGYLRPDSDLDLLVVVSSVEHRGDLAARIHESFWGLLVPIDVVVATPADLEEYSGCSYSVIGAALAEGRVIYEAPVAQPT